MFWETDCGPSILGDITVKMVSFITASCFDVAAVFIIQFREGACFFLIFCGKVIVKENFLVKIKGAVSRNSAKLDNSKLSVRLRET